MERDDSEISIQSVEDSPKKPDKNAELRQTFGIPDSEALIDDFICALKRSILYQGRLYIFDNYACFDSYLFGRQKTLVVSLKELKALKKRKNYGFPNSIEMVHRGRRDLLTSFLKRDDAFKMLKYAWEKSNPNAARLGLVGSRELSATDSKKVLGSRHLAKLIGRPLSADGSQSVVETSKSSETDSSASKSFKGTQESLIGNQISANSQPASSGPPVEASPRYTESQYDSDDDDIASETTDLHDEVERWQPVKEPPPPLDPDMSQLIEAELNISVRTFYKEFFSDDTQFFISWHESRGDTKVQLSEWRKHQTGYVRDLTFVTPLKQKIGPSKCLCTQTQRTRLHPEDHLVFNTSQIMDIPYGDYFSVNTQWDVVPINDGKACKVTINLAIPFSKKTMFKSTIESSTKQLMTVAYENWISTARKWLEDPLPIHPQPPNTAFADAPGGEDFDDGPTHFSRAQSLAARMSLDWRGTRQLSQNDMAPAPSLSRAGTGTGKSVSFEQADNQGASYGWLVGTAKNHPVQMAVFGILLLQIVYILLQLFGFVEARSLYYVPPVKWPTAKSWLGENDDATAALHQEVLAMQRQLEHITTLLQQGCHIGQQRG